MSYINSEYYFSSSLTTASLLAFELFQLVDNHEINKAVYIDRSILYIQY